MESSRGPSAYQPNALLLDKTRSLAPEGFKHQIYMVSQGLQVLGKSNMGNDRIISHSRQIRVTLESTM